MSENQKRLLQQALDMLEEQALHIEAPMLPAGEELLNRIRAAISQQVEPAPEPRDKRIRPSYLDQAVIDRVAESSARHLEEIGRGLAEPAAFGFDYSIQTRTATGTAQAEPPPAQDERDLVAETLEWYAGMGKSGARARTALATYQATRPAQTEQPEQSEELAWKVLQAATDALDRRAAPHAWISQAWNTGSEVITSRRPVRRGRDE